METRPMCSNLAHFEDWVRLQLKEHNMSVSRLAKISGVHPNTIRNYLAGRCEPSFYNVVCIVTALGYDVMAVKR